MAEKPEAEILRAVTFVTGGSFFLFGGRFLSYLIGFVGAAITARLLVGEYGSSAPYGWLLAIGFVPSLVTIMGDFGSGSGAVNKMIVNLKSGDHTTAAKYFWSWTIFSLGLSIIYVILTLVLGIAIASSLFQKPEIEFLIPLAALGNLAMFVYNAGWNGCIATDSIWANGTMLITQMSTQAVLAPILLVEGYGIYGVTAVYLVLAPVLAGIVGMVVASKKVRPVSPDLAALRSSLTFGLPLAGGLLAGSIQSNLYNALLSRFGTSAQLGNYSVAQRVGPLVDVVEYPINTISFPFFSSLSTKENVAAAFRAMVKLLALLAIPMSLMLLSLSPLVIVVLYGNGYAAGWPYLSLLSVSWLIGGLGTAVTTSLLTGQAKTTLNFRISVVGSVVGILASVILVPVLGVTGAILVSVIASIPPLLLSLKYISELYGVRYPMKEVAKVVLLSAASAASAFGLARFTASLMPMILALIVSGGIGLIFYAVAIKRFEVISKEELELIERSSVSIPIGGRFIHTIVYIYRRI